jgi:hypothetical protein
MASTAQMSYLASTSNFGITITWQNIEAVDHSAGPQPLLGLNPEAATWYPSTSIQSTSGAAIESLRIMAGEVNTGALDSVV